MTAQPTPSCTTGTGAAAAVYAGPPISAALDRRIRTALAPTAAPRSLRTAAGRALPAGFTTTVHGRHVIVVSVEVDPDLSVLVALEGPGAPIDSLRGSLTGKGVTLRPEDDDATGGTVQQLLHDAHTTAALILGHLTTAADYRLQCAQPGLHTRYDRIRPRELAAPHPLAGKLAGSVAAAFSQVLNLGVDWGIRLSAQDEPAQTLLHLLHETYRTMPTVTERDVALAMIRGGYTGTAADLFTAVAAAGRA